MVKNVKLFLLALMLVTIPVIVSCSGSRSDNNGTPVKQFNQQNPKEQTAAPEPQTVKIIFEMGQAEEQGVDAYKGNFHPPTMEVPVGTIITWENADGFLRGTHTVTGRDGLFNKELRFGESFNYTFTKTGVYKYYCDIHNIMTGEIDVR